MWSNTNDKKSEASSDDLCFDESFAAISTCKANNAGEKEAHTRTCPECGSEVVRCSSAGWALVINQSRGRSLMRGHYAAIGTNWAQSKEPIWPLAAVISRHLPPTPSIFVSNINCWWQERIRKELAKNTTDLIAWINRYIVRSHMKTKHMLQKKQQPPKIHKYLAKCISYAKNAAQFLPWECVESHKEEAMKELLKK